MSSQPPSPTQPAEIMPVFAVPLAQAMHGGANDMNSALKALLLSRDGVKRYANPQPSLVQQPGVFESEFNLFSWPEGCVQQLKEFCWTELGRTIAQLNNYSAAEMRRLKIYSHSWFHVTRHGGFVVAHAHPMASWSGVYCVTPGETPHDRPESGVLRFHNPHQYSNMFQDPGNSNFRPPYHHGTWNAPLQPGQLVLFPSWLPHEVLPFYGSDQRITIAFNCWFGMHEAQAT